MKKYLPFEKSSGHIKFNFDNPDEKRLSLVQKLGLKIRKFWNKLKKIPEKITSLFYSAKLKRSFDNPTEDLRQKSEIS